MTHVVMLSGGVTSWAAGKRVAERYGTDDLILLFADTRGEDPDCYRFLREGAANIGGRLVEVMDGRTIWDVFRDRRRIGNAQVAPCSEELKTKVCKRWLEANCDPAETTLYLGLDWTEPHRIAGARKRWAPWRVDFPLATWSELGGLPLMDKAHTLAWCRAEGIEPPKLYAEGFSHANCGGFCVRMGHAQAALLLRTHPDRYAYAEEQEQRLREYLGRDDVAVMRDRRGGETRPITLRQLRERIERNEYDADDWGACGCFVGDESLEFAAVSPSPGSEGA